MNQKEIKDTITTLKNGGVILYPTDTIWGIGCDATNPEAIKKIFKIKKRADNKAMISLVADKEQLKKITQLIPKFDITSVPTTIIYPSVKVIDKSLLVDGSAAIRIVQDKFCQKIISALKKPIVSTSANISGQNPPTQFSEITKEITDHVDYIVNLRKNEKRIKSSQIFKLISDGSMQKIR